MIPHKIWGSLFESTWRPTKNLQNILIFRCACMTIIKNRRLYMQKQYRQSLMHNSYPCREQIILSRPFLPNLSSNCNSRCCLHWRQGHCNADELHTPYRAKKTQSSHSLQILNALLPDAIILMSLFTFLWAELDSWHHNTTWPWAQKKRRQGDGGGEGVLPGKQYLQSVEERCGTAAILASLQAGSPLPLGASQRKSDSCMHKRIWHWSKTFFNTNNYNLTAI